MNLQWKDMIVVTLRFCPDRPIVIERGFDLVLIRLPFLLETAASASRSWVMSLSAEVWAAATNQLLGTAALPSNVTPFPHASSRPIDMVLRCSPRGLAEFERARAGGALIFRFWVRAQCALLSNVSGGGPLLGEPQELTANEDVSIDLGLWVAALNRAKLSASLLVEVPFPMDGTVNDDALKALSDAVASFGNGGSTAWKDTVGHIRPFLEAWSQLEPLPSRDLSDGSAADRRYKLLAMRNSLYKTCHFFVHESAAACTRDDALLILTTFAALIKATR